MRPVKCLSRIQERFISLWVNNTGVKPELISLVLVSEFLSSIRIRVCVPRSSRVFVSAANGRPSSIPEKTRQAFDLVPDTERG